MSEQFEWPCDKQKAHGPHLIDDEVAPSFDDIECPGVPAHPSTMIGGNYDRW